MAFVLDLDLDFFVWPIEHSRIDGRLESNDYRSATTAQVEAFLEDRCGLSKTNRLPGHFCLSHEEAFNTWATWLDRSLIETGFQIAHVDAHADLGLGDNSWAHIFRELLAHPPGERRNLSTSWEGFNCANYLTFAIANRWISRVTYVYPTGSWNELEEVETLHDGSPGDLHPFLFRDQSLDTRIVELGHYDKAQTDLMMMRPESHPVSIGLEPPVPFNWISANRYRDTGFTHVILAHSMPFTPQSADDLIPIIQQYFYEI